MKTVDTLLREVALHAPWAAAPAATLAIMRAAEELCTRSWVWKERLDTEVAVDAAMPIEPCAPRHSRVLHIVSAWVAGDTLQPMSLEFVRSRAQDAQKDLGGPAAFYADTPYEVWLWPVPAEPVVVTFAAVLAPTLDATRLPDELVDDYGEGIVAGALTRLLILPATGQADATKAVTMRGVFERAVSRAKRKALFGNAPGNARITPHPLA